jgi:hypothetical protein
LAAPVTVERAQNHVQAVAQLSIFHSTSARQMED